MPTHLSPPGRLAVLHRLAVGCLGGTLLSVAAAPPNFAPAVSYAIGDAPIAMTVGDLNGDHHPDLISADQLGDTISVLIGNGDGSFRAAVHYGVGNEPMRVVTGDFNADGKCDVAVADSWSDQISVLLGNGDGTLQSAAPYGAGGHPQGLATADVNGDGKLDLIAANAFDQEVGVLLGNGNGTFQGPVSYPANTYPVSVSVRDLNHDGKLDLAVLNQNAGMSILLGQGDGSFGGPVAYSSGHAQDIVAGEFNGDGHLDVAVSNNSDAGISMFLGKGDGTFQSAATHAVSGTSFGIAVGDFNADGLVDLAVNALHANSVRILPGRGDGTFEPLVTMAVGDAPYFGLVVADLNSDGSTDLAVANHDSDNVSVLLNLLPTLGLVVDVVQSCPGSTISIPVRASRAATLGTLQFSMHWDPTVVTLSGVDQFGLPDLTAANFGDITTSGTLAVSWDDPNPAGTAVAPGATLFALVFNLTGARGATSEVTIDGVPVAIEVTDPSMNPMGVSWQDGQIDLGKIVNISGRVSYYAASRAVPGVNVDLTGDATQSVPTDAVGEYLHTLLGCADFIVTPAKSTDVPTAAGVSMLDAALVRLHVLGKLALDSPFKRIAADVNGSRTITTLDIRLIRQLVLDTRVSFPAGLWRFVRSDYVFPNPLSPWWSSGSRSYPDLASDATGQDYLAVKLGDVNGSWNSGAALMSLAGSSTHGKLSLQAASKPAQLKIASDLVHRGSRVKLAVSGRNLKQLTSAQFTLAWNPAVLRYAGVSGFGLPSMDSDCFGTHKVSQGMLMFAWDDPQARGVTIGNPTDLFFLNFDVLGAVGSRTAIVIAKSPTPQEITLNFSVTSVEVETGLVTVSRFPRL